MTKSMPRQVMGSRTNARFFVSPSNAALFPVASHRQRCLLVVVTHVDDYRSRSNYSGNKRACTNHDRPRKFDLVERRALYGATRGLVPKWRLQGFALPRVPPPFFLALFSAARRDLPTFLRICNSSAFHARHDNRHHVR